MKKIKNKLDKDTLLIYFFSDYKESFLNLYFSVNELKLLEPQNIYSILVIQSEKFMLDKRIIKKFNHNLKVNCKSDLYGYLKGINNINLDNFDYFIFLNSSCIGPVLPSYLKSENWDYFFKSQIGDANLISPIIEFPPIDDKYVKNLKSIPKLSNLKKLETIPFAHSYFLYMRKEAIKCILNNKGFPDNDIDKEKAVGYFERYITALLISQNFKIKSLLRKYQSKYISLEVIPNLIKIFNLKNNQNQNLTDPEIPDIGYFGTDLHPYEVIFFKNLRFEHSHRGAGFSNISLKNSNFLNNIIGLNEARDSFNLTDDVRIDQSKHSNKKNSKNSIYLQVKNKIIKLFKYFKK